MVACEMQGAQMAMSALTRKIKAVLLGKRGMEYKSRDKRNHKKFI